MDDFHFESNTFEFNLDWPISLEKQIIFGDEVSFKMNGGAIPKLCL